MEAPDLDLCASMNTRPAPLASTMYLARGVAWALDCEIERQIRQVVALAFLDDAEALDA